MFEQIPEGMSPRRHGPGRGVNRKIGGTALAGGQGFLLMQEAPAHGRDQTIQGGCEHGEETLTTSGTTCREGSGLASTIPLSDGQKALLAPPAYRTAVVIRDNPPRQNAHAISTQAENRSKCGFSAEASVVYQHQ